MSSRGRGRGVKVPKGRAASSRGAKAAGTSGRGRGRGKSKFVDEDSNFDDDDEFCDQALREFELANNEVTEAFAGSRNLDTIPGFEIHTGDVWIYPTNRAVRDYQFSIVQNSLFHNTLVCLPTGLGKTFIAAVVMFNFHRWYPNDIIVFMAPTRPLVTQQLDACHNIVGIDPNKTVELTGQIVPSKRESLWQDKKVFFLTPQVMQSDIARGSCPTERVRCVVIDEAHKALGNHSYAEVVKAIFSVNKHFRVLGLSATPGNDILAIQQVLRNLLISKIELRTDRSPDILPYIHDKGVETVVVKMDPFLSNVHSKIIDLYQIYTGKLMQRKIIPYNGSSFVAFQLLQARQKFRTSLALKMTSYEKQGVEITFQVCISLSRAIDLLQYHGLRSFYLYIKGVLIREKGSAIVASELKKQNIEEILEPIREHLNITLENSSFNISASALFDSMTEDNMNHIFEQKQSSDPEDYLRSHPKMRALKGLVENHFRLHDKNTRIMIFSQYRDSVQEIGNLMNLIPNVKAMIFMGQAKTAGAGGRGLKQKEQVQVVEKFRNGNFNVLVATSVGEEGLDIGEVDLIICFDSNKSPTRNMQRMGRTGRQRDGQIVYLLTEGKEERMYSSSIYKQSNITKNITDASKLRPYLYETTPRMIPNGVEPQCFKMNIILSSEQKKSQEATAALLSEMSMSSFDRSAFMSTKDKKESQKKNRLKKLKSSSSLAASPTKTLFTLHQCVQRMESKKQLPCSTATSTKPIETVVIDEESEDVPQFEPQAYTPPQCEDHLADRSSEDYNVMLSVFDVHEMKPESEPLSCVYIPKIKSPDGWDWNPMTSSDFTDADLLTIDDVEALREKVDAELLMGENRNCRCGFVASDNNSFFRDEPFAQAGIMQGQGATSTSIRTETSLAATAVQTESKDNEVDSFFCDDESFLFADDWDPDAENTTASKNQPDNLVLDNNVDENAAKIWAEVSVTSAKPKSAEPPRPGCDSDDSTASESEWNTAFEVSNMGRSPRSPILQTGKEFAKPGRGTDSLATSIPSPKAILGSTGPASSSTHSKPKFVFKKKPSFQLFVANQSRVPDATILCSATFCEPPSENSRTGFPSSSSRGAKDCDPDLDFIPGTSSEDEDDEIRKPDKSGPAAAMPDPPFSNVHDDNDSDATDWDPNEVIGQLHEESKGENTTSFIASRQSEKRSPKKPVLSERNSAFSVETHWSSSSPVVKSNTPRHNAVTPKRTAFEISQNTEESIGHEGRPLKARKPCLSKESRASLKELSASMSCSPAFGGESSDSSKPKTKFQFRRKDTAVSSKSSETTSFKHPRDCSGSPLVKSKPAVDPSFASMNYDDDDDIVFLEQKPSSSSTPKTPARTPNQSVASSTESPDEAFVRRKNYVKRRIIRSTEPTSPSPRIPKRKKPNVKKNPFLWDEAADDSGPDSEMDDLDCSEDMRSFVADEDEDDFAIVSATQQQAMYMQSVKDVIPNIIGRIENPLPREDFFELDASDTDDSICTNEVEYADVGVFTQCMIQAREEVDHEEKTGKRGRRLRSRKK